MKLILTPKRLDIQRLTENEVYLTNGYWMVDKTKIDMQNSLIKNLYIAYTKSDSQYKELNSAVTLETCQKVIDRGLEGDIETITPEEIQKSDINGVWADNGVPFIDFTNKEGKATRANAYFIKFMEKLGAISFDQTQTFSYQPILCRNARKEIIGVVMPMRID